jgi:hypothetical protein
VAPGIGLDATNERAIESLESHARALLHDMRFALHCGDGLTEVGRPRRDVGGASFLRRKKSTLSKFLDESGFAGTIHSPGADANLAAIAAPAELTIIRDAAPFVW